MQSPGFEPASPIIVQDIPSCLPFPPCGLPQWKRGPLQHFPGCPEETQRPPDLPEFLFLELFNYPVTPQHIEVMPDGYRFDAEFVGEFIHAHRGHREDLCHPEPCPHRKSLEYLGALQRRRDKVEQFPRLQQAYDLSVLGHQYAPHLRFHEHLRDLPHGGVFFHHGRGMEHYPIDCGMGRVHPLGNRHYNVDVSHDAYRSSVLVDHEDLRALLRYHEFGCLKNGGSGVELWDRQGFYATQLTLCDSSHRYKINLLGIPNELGRKRKAYRCTPSYEKSWRTRKHHGSFQ